jgi:hypothetical protein
VLEVASRRRDAYFELLDLRDYPVPLQNQSRVV